MDNLKELLAPKTFNKVSYFAVICWIPIGVIFFGIFLEMEIAESRLDFRCGGAKSKDIDLVRGRCFELYEKQYNKHSLPIYAIVILNFFLIVSVCKGDEGQSRCRENALTSGKKLFIAYCCQLFMRIVLGVLFMVLQTKILYPTDFPSRFRCDPNSEGDKLWNPSGVIQNSTSISHDCHNQRATKKNSWMKAILVVNGIFVFVVLLEAVYILLRTWKKEGFIKNSQFLKAHLSPPRSNSQNNTTTPTGLTQVQSNIPLMPSESEQLRTTPLQDFVEKTKKIIKEDTSRPPQLRSPFSSTPGEGQPAKHLTLDQIYTKLVFVPDRAKYNFTGDRREKLEVYAKLGEKTTTPRGPRDILNHENKKVLIVGRPGIGKTLWCSKLLRDWAFNKVFCKTPGAEIHFDAAFFIKFRTLNAENDLSLRELLTLSEHSPSEHMDDEVWNYICENPERVLFIFDGIDEFKHNSKIGDENYDPKFKDDVDEKMPVHALYEKLATGKLLKGAAVLTTTRPTALSCIERIHFDKVFNVRENVRNTNILSLCYIPASCFIICSSLFQILNFKGSLTLSLPTKLTDIYKKAVKIFYLRHNEEFRGKNVVHEDLESDDLPREVEEKFKKPEKMAFKGIQEGRLIFGGKEVLGMEDSALFHRLLDRRTDELNREKQFCFIHLTMQEFFAARHLANMNETELRNFVSENIMDGKWELVFQFLAGLMNDKEKLPSKIITRLLPVKTEENENVLYNEEWLEVDLKQKKLTYWPTKDKNHLAVTLIKCCSENSEMKDTVQRKLQQINFNFADFNHCQLTAVDCASLVSVIENQGKKFTRLQMGGNNIGPLGCLEICKLLKCRKSRLSWLNLSGNQLTDEGAKYLADAIRDNNCRLRWLYLTLNDITDTGLQHLAQAISNENCQLRWLFLTQNYGITKEAKQHTFKLLRRSPFVFNLIL